MACFIVPGTEAIVSTIITKMIEKKENKELELNLKKGVAISELHKEKLSTKLKRLNGLLWGGSVLLAFEHVWHGEVQPFFPFLTAASNPADMAEMISEMSRIGVSMAVLVTIVWLTMTFFLCAFEKQVDSIKEKQEV